MEDVIDGSDVSGREDVAYSEVGCKGRYVPKV
jgi:hypothetical protein